TCTGVMASFGALPLPSWPDWLLPHARTVPSPLSASANESPAATATTALPLARPETRVGARRFVVVPSPSSPERLLPQANTEPSFRAARLNALPADIVATLLIPVTATGVELSAVPPVPSCPDRL